MMSLPDRIAYWQKRAEMTDAQLLAEWCEQQRAEARSQADGLAKSIADEAAVEAEIRRTGSEEG